MEQGQVWWGLLYSTMLLMSFLEPTFRNCQSHRIFMFTGTKWKSRNHVLHSSPSSDPVELNAAISLSCGLWLSFITACLLPLQTSSTSNLQFLTGPYRHILFLTLGLDTDLLKVHNLQVFWNTQKNESWILKWIENESRKLNWEKQTLLSWILTTLTLC